MGSEPRQSDPFQPQSPSLNPTRRSSSSIAKSSAPKKDKRAMERFRNAVMAIASYNPSNSNGTLMDAEKRLIEEQLAQFFSNFHTPDHPPYAAMIQRAIEELNEENGSSEKSISQFIEKEYKDLPWAHSVLLKHHLEKLCDCNEILLTRPKCYVLAFADGDLKRMTQPKKKKRKKKNQLNTGMGSRTCKKCLMEDGFQVDRQCGSLIAEGTQCMETTKVVPERNCVIALSHVGIGGQENKVVEDEPRVEENNHNNKTELESKIEKNLSCAERREAKELTNKLLRLPLKKSKTQESQTATENVLNCSEHNEQENSLEFRPATDLSTNHEKIEQVEILALPGPKIPQMNNISDGQQSDKEGQPIIILEKLRSIDLMATGEGFQTERQQRQMKRWSRRYESECMSAVTFPLALYSPNVLSNDQIPLQTVFPNAKTAKLLQQTPVMELGQRAKLRSWQKQKIVRLNTKGSLDTLEEICQPLERRLRNHAAEVLPTEHLVEEQKRALVKDVLSAQHPVEEQQPVRRRGRPKKLKPYAPQFVTAGDGTGVLPAQRPVKELNQPLEKEELSAQPQVKEPFAAEVFPALHSVERQSQTWKAEVLSAPHPVVEEQALRDRGRPKKVKPIVPELLITEKTTRSASSRTAESNFQS